MAVFTIKTYNKYLKRICVMSPWASIGQWCAEVPGANHFLEKNFTYPAKISDDLFCGNFIYHAENSDDLFSFTPKFLFTQLDNWMPPAWMPRAVPSTAPPSARHCCRGKWCISTQGF